MFMALHVPALLRLWRCVLSRFFALACGIDQSLSLLWRHAYGFACFLRVYVCGLRVAIFFCAVEVVCRCGFMLLLLSFPVARDF